MTAQTHGYGTGDCSYKAAGELAGIRELVNEFYNIMGQLPQAKLILDMHPKDLTDSRQKLAYFLSGWLGGPKLYAHTYGPINIPLAHKHLNIGSLQRDAWLQCMQQALDKQPYATSFKHYLLEQLSIPAKRIQEACNSPSCDV